MTRVLLTARIGIVNNVMFENRIRKMVDFELGKEIGKDFVRLVTKVGQRKISESSRGIELQMLRCSTTVT